MAKSSSSVPESRVYRWLDERLGLTEIIALAGKKRVPEHKHSFWYYWGGITLFFFVVMCITGVLLLVYYRPGESAYESVRLITYDIKFGWLVRSIHSWSANLMVAAAFVHMFSTFFMKAYRRPREVLWITGIGLLSMAMVFGFSGYLLPMDELAFFATKVGLAIPATLPVVGPWLSDLVRGGPEVSAYTVSRFFALHVVILPALFVPLLGIHLALVQKYGMSLPESEEAKPESERKTIPFFPNFAMKDLAVWLIALNVLGFLAAVYPWQLGPAADPLMPAPKDIHPEWYFMSSFQILKIFGNWFPGALGEFLGIAVFSVGVLLWAIVPFFDPEKRSGLWARRVTWFGFFVVFVLLLTTIWGYAVLPAGK
ncbi:MAG TPA: cytochrome bc complex cytochrome b subunit [Fibrobacteria bacterium]|nr:cytochrome bc complex cytochrome b subunit [Fibrobacteria bacterium]HOX50983.1 cytochrome bc complex cytochrome b subunit [Fibrobacteria bacterium]